MNRFEPETPTGSLRLPTPPGVYLIVSPETFTSADALNILPGYTAGMKVAAFLGAVLLISGLTLWRESPTVGAAKSFLKTLAPEQKVASIFPFQDQQRFKFSYVPETRKGVSWAEMDTQQKESAENLLRTVLSQEGYKKAEGIRQLELVLRQLENNNLGRDPQKYWFAFYGEPSAKGKWAFHYEGHHLSLIFAFENGQMVASTPQFVGSNPGEVREGKSAGIAYLKKEQKLAYELLDSLSPEQQREVVISTEAPDDIVTTTRRHAKLDHHLGLPVKLMSAAQKGTIEKLLNAHSEIQTAPEQKRRLKRALSDPEIKFAWLGSLKPGERHYYRIQGERFLIEYDNTQNNANHIHTVWRDFEEDFGGDALKDHYAHSH